MPDGLSLDSATAVISGTPRTSSNTTCTFTVEDALNEIHTADFTQAVSMPPAVVNLLSGYSESIPMTLINAYPDND